MPTYPLPDSDALSQMDAVELLKSPDPFAAGRAATRLMSEAAPPSGALLDLVRSGQAAHYNHFFLSRVLGHHSKAAAHPLVDMIRSEGWGVKLNASQCFRFMPQSECALPLGELLSEYDFDVKRCAISALGFLGSEVWNNTIHKQATSSSYYLEKLGPYALEAFTRMLTQKTDTGSISHALAQIEELITDWPKHDPDTIYFHHFYVSNVFPELTAAAADGITKKWLTHRQEVFRSFAARALGYLRLTRSVGPLAERLLDDGEEYSVRHSAAVAIGEIGGADANKVLSEALNSLPRSQEPAPGIHMSLDESVRVALSWRFYEAEVGEGARALVEEMLAGSESTRGMASYALGWLGFGEDEIAEGLSSPDDFVRGASALGLARAKGAGAAERLASHEAESSSPFEHIMTLAALVICGQAERADDLHAALSEFRQAPSFQYHWKRELLAALSMGGEAGRAQAWAEVMNVNIERCLGEISSLLRRKGVEPPAPQAAGTGRATPGGHGSGPAAATEVAPVRVFVSYSHQDRKYMRKGYLIDYLSGLERHGIEFWSDEDILGGEMWDQRIKDEMARADIALVLVSQPFLNSEYCRNVEVENFIKLRAEKGLKIYPIIISACSWKDHEWLRATQSQPRDDKTVERNYKSRDKRDELFLKIMQELKELSDVVRAGRRR